MGHTWTPNCPIYFLPIPRLSSGELAGVIQFAQSVFPPGAVAGEHRHEDMAEVFWVESGQGRIVVEGREYALAPRTCVVVEVGEAHDTLQYRRG